MNHLLVLVFGPCRARTVGDVAPVIDVRFACMRHRGHGGPHIGKGNGLIFRWAR